MPPFPLSSTYYLTLPLSALLSNSPGSAVFLTLSHSVVDHVVVHEHPVRSEDADGGGEAVVERTSLEVGLVHCNLLQRERRILFIHSSPSRSLHMRQAL